MGNGTRTPLPCIRPRQTIGLVAWPIIRPRCIGIGGVVRSQTALTQSLIVPVNWPDGAVADGAALCCDEQPAKTAMAATTATVNVLFTAGVGIL
ncbi:hypothetical protein BN000_05576 [Mycobacterium europaeum]|uniref:Uncharacterized protein n=1 Tax=Mycobacterium europaeum TaxID=761804 RepID=A0A0U1DT03_9MYCO|nr:hypothetical protein BN000_05576 [Mycobacterium europaeum]